MLSVSGGENKDGKSVWRFAESTDNGLTWRQTDVRLPRGGKPLDRYSYTGDYRDAVGPGHFQRSRWRTHRRTCPCTCGSCG